MDPSLQQSQGLRKAPGCPSVWMFVLQHHYSCTHPHTPLQEPLQGSTHCYLQALVLHI